MRKELEKMLKAKSHIEVERLILGESHHKFWDVYQHRDGDKSFTIIYPLDMDWGKEVMPCIVSHTDIVGQKPPTRLKVCDGIVTNPDGILGADDRAGCYMIGEMVKKQVRAIYIITSGEEIGGLGAGECGASNVFNILIDNISAFIELDRENVDHCATYGYDNEAFIKLWNDRGYKTEMGSYTDVVDLASASGIPCVNLSIGYEMQHSKNEYLILDACYATLDIMMNDMPQELYEVKYEVEDGFDPLYDMNWGIEPVVCEFCNDHTELYYSEGLMICAECMVEEGTRIENHAVAEMPFWNDNDYGEMK